MQSRGRVRHQPESDMRAQGAPALLCVEPAMSQRVAGVHKRSAANARFAPDPWPIVTPAPARSAMRKAQSLPQARRCISSPWPALGGSAMCCSMEEATCSTADRVSIKVDPDLQPRHAAEPPPDAGRVGGRVGQLVSVNGLGQVVR
jgi:hypothetical protein